MDKIKMSNKSILEQVETLESSSNKKLIKKSSDSYQTAHTALTSFTTNFKSNKLSTRGIFGRSLQNAIDELTSYTKLTGTQREHYPIRKSVKYILNVLKTLKDDHTDKSLTPPVAKKIIKSKLDPKIAEMEEHAEDIINSNPLEDKVGKSRNEEEFLSVRESMTKYAKFERKLPNKLRRPQAFQIAEVPVMADLPGNMKSPSYLKHIKIPHTVVGSGINAIGIVFEKQNILMFSKSNAIADAQLLHLESLVGHEVDADEFNADPKKYSTAMKRESFDKYTLSKRNGKKKIKALYTQIAQTYNYTTKPDIQEFVNSQLDLKTPGARSGFEYNALANEIFKNKKSLVRTVMSVIDPLLDTIEKHYLAIDKATEQSAAAKYKLKELEKTKMKSDVVLLRYANAAVDEISKQSGHDYTLISANAKLSPRNSDIVMYWIVSKVFHNILDQFSGDGLEGVDWSFPWNSRAKKLKTIIPSDINDLSVNYGRGK